MSNRFYLVPVLAWLALLAGGAAAQEQTTEQAPAAAPSVPAGTDRASAGPASVDKEQRDRDYFTDLPLLTQDGKAVRFYSDVLRGHVVLINFIFTHCEDACPLLARKLSEVQGMLGEEMGKPIYLISISVDPERDTPQALKEFGKRFGAGDGWVFLTGEKANIDHIVKKLGQYNEDVQDHSTAMIIGNVKTRHWKKMRPDTPTAVMAEELRTLAREG